MSRRESPYLAVALCSVLSLVPAAAQTGGDEPDEKWHDAAEFSFVATSGNSETTTLGLKNKLWRKWSRNAFELNAGAVRSEGTTNRRAEGTVDDFDVEEDSEKTAESYYLNGRYDRSITDRFFWFGTAGWDRNTFAGIDNRYAVAAGVGNIWDTPDTIKFRTDYALSYTDQEDVVEVPGIDNTFMGVRVSWNYWHKFGAVTEYVNEFIGDENLEETTDWRLNMINSVTVALSGRLALKVSLQWLYDHQPAFETLPLFDGTGAPTGVTVISELDELDSIFTSSLVLKI